MEIRVLPKSILDVECDCLVVNLFEGVQSPGGATGAVDKALGGLISDMISHGDFKGKLNETVIAYTGGKIPARKVLVVGLGKQEDFTLDRIRMVAGTAARHAEKSGCKRLASILHGAGIGGKKPADAAQALVEGTLLGTYRFSEYRAKTEDAPEIEEFLIVEKDEQKAKDALDGARRGRILAEATNFARDLVTTPGNKLTPAILAEKAREIAAEFGLEYHVLEPKEMEELGMGALLGVAKGSAEEPRLLVLSYKSGRAEEKLALVGKGLTFDAGGISLKPADGMHEMKFDMAGGAAVIGAIRALAQLKPSLDVVAVVPAAENLPDGKAQKPGDVVKAMNGKTIEVQNTDAEGRLILADAIAYAKEKLGATKIVDIATLTGAAVIALGHVTTALISNNEELAGAVLDAAREAGEKVWRLPAFDEYKEQYKSDVADLKNIGGRPAGTITGGLIVGEFAGDTPWAHLDIAGTAFLADERPYRGKGATGVGVRTLVNLAMNLGERY